MILLVHGTVPRDTLPKDLNLRSFRTCAKVMMAINLDTFHGTYDTNTSSLTIAFGEFYVP